MTPEEFKTRIQALLERWLIDPMKAHKAYDALMEETLLLTPYHEGISLVREDRPTRWYG